MYACDDLADILRDWAPWPSDSLVIADCWPVVLAEALLRTEVADLDRKCGAVDFLVIAREAPVSVEAKVRALRRAW